MRQIQLQNAVQCAGKGEHNEAKKLLIESDIFCCNPAISGEF